MKKIASLFSPEMRHALEKHLDINLTDDKEYSDDDLMELYARITDDFPYEYRENGEPAPMGELFEGIIDVFVKNNLPL